MQLLMHQGIVITYSNADCNICLLQQKYQTRSLIKGMFVIYLLIILLVFETKQGFLEYFVHQAVGNPS